MNAIIDAQGRKPFDHNQPALGALCFDVCASTGGIVTSIDNLQLARIAGLAGAPKVNNAGVDLQHKLGDMVQPGAVLYRVHASFAADLEFARQASRKASGYTIGTAADMPHVFVEF
jgi:thymidine phosphorylase